MSIADRPLMVRWFAAIAVVLFAPIAHAEFDPVGADGWPKGASLASMRGLPECEGPLRGEPGAAIPCRPPLGRGGSPIAYSMDWTTGLSLADGTSGGNQAWGHELLVAVTRSLQLGGRYELMGTGLDDRMATTVIGHNLFALARYRMFTDEVDRSAWTIGAGVGWAARETGSAPIARLAIGHDFGAFVTKRSALTSGLELAYEQSLDDSPQQNLVGSIKLGFELGIRKPKNLGEAARSSGPATSIHVGVLAMPGLSFGLDATVGVGRGRITWENTVGYLFGMTEERKLTGLDGSQWSALSGARLHWWQVAYAQAQAGAAWISGRDGGHVEGLWHAELGIDLGCVETGVWMQQSFEGERTSGGILFRVGRGARPGFCGGGRGSSRPHFAVEYIPPPPPPVIEEKVVEEKVVVEDHVVEEKVIVVEKPVVVVVPPLVIELEIRGTIDLRSLPLDKLYGGRVAIEITGSPRSIAGVEMQLRRVLGAARIQVDAWARVAAPGPLRVRFTIARRD